MYSNALLVALCLTVCSIGNATINIGTLIFKPPYILSPNNGFDVDLAEMICQQLHEPCRYIPMGNAALYRQLEDGKVDLAIGGIPISYDTKTPFIYSMPYLVSKAQFLVPKDSPVGSIDQLTGTTIGALRNRLNGEIFYDYLINHYSAHLKINVYNDIEDIMADLSTKQLSSAFLDSASVNYWIEQGGGQFKSLGPVYSIGNGIAIAALPKNKELLVRINTILERIEKNTSYIKLYETYF